MNNNDNNYMNQMPLPGSQPKSGGVGAIIAVIIITALVVCGGYYFWQQVKDRKAMNQDHTISPELQSTSTEAINAELEADLRAMQSDDLGESDTEEIDSEFSR